MTDENLGQVLDDGIADFQRRVTVVNLGKRGHLTIEQLAKLVAHDKHGETVKGITLQELLDVQKRIEAGEDVMPLAPEAAPKKKPPGSGKKAGATKAKAAPKPANKPAAAKKAAKKTTKKVSKKAAKKTTAKKKAAKKPAGDADGKKGPKADKGKPKPRLDYPTGTREVLAAIKAAGAPMGRSDIEAATGYTGVQVRAFCKKLQKEGKIEVQGTGGRSTLYALPGSSN